MLKPGISYPRRRMVRASLRFLGRALVPVLADVEIHGMNKYPRRGPLIVVGNHSGAMEVVLMTVYSPRLVEFLGSIDIPHETYIAAVIKAYGFIPFHRGRVSRTALETSLEVLNQGGVLGIFPEGGIWEPAIRRAQAGVAWLSYRAQAPVLPIGFSSTRGALNAMLRLQRPGLAMRVGDVLPPVQVVTPGPRKQQLQEAANRIMDSIWALVPEMEKPEGAPIDHESFELVVEIEDRDERQVPVPSALSMEHGNALSKFIHRTTLFNNLLENVRLPIQPLRHLHDEPETEAILRAAAVIIEYLEHENPYYFTYRYGQAEGGAMAVGVRELHDLASWVLDHGYRMKLKALRRFIRQDSGKSVVLEEPMEHEKW